MPVNRNMLFLIDATVYIYRAYYSSNSTGMAGEPHGAVWGFFNMLNRIIRFYAPRYMVAIFDAKGKTFRNEMYPEYKANRPLMPDDFRRQYDLVREIIPEMGIPVLSIPGVEADDVIGTLATEANKHDVLTVIASVDKDLAQLVTNRVVLFDEFRDSVLNPEGVFKKFGVHPSQIADYLALVGDVVDNVPGVPGVGPKTAATWLKSYGSLDGILDNANSIKGKVGENLRNNIERVHFSRQLVELKLDVDVEFNLDSFRFSLPGNDLLNRIQERLNHPSL